MRRLALALLVLAVALPAEAPAEAVVTYVRDPMVFMKAHHAAELRRPGTGVPRKFHRMSESAIAFFRGGAPLFYQDLVEQPQLRRPVTLPLMGDLHLENVGALRTAAGAFTFDFNDFDEAFTGPYTWELARGAVSVRLHAAANGLPEAAQDRLVRRFLAGYLAKLQTAEKGLARPLTAADVPGPAAKAIADAQAGEATFLADWARGGRFLRRRGGDLATVPAGTARKLAAALGPYGAAQRRPAGYFKVKDAVRRIAGLASLARMRYVVLVEGPTAAPGDDVLLELKEQGAPAAAPAWPVPRGNGAERVRAAWAYFVPGGVEGLGVAGDYLVRRVTPWQDDVDVAGLKTEAAFGAYVDAVALVAARGHARSGKAGAIARDAGDAAKLDALVGRFAAAYTPQVESDREVFQGYVNP